MSAQRREVFTRDHSLQGKYYCTAGLQFAWIGFYQTRKYVATCTYEVKLPNPNIFSCLAESNTVKLETSCKVIDTLTKYVSFLRFRHRFYLKIFFIIDQYEKVSAGLYGKLFHHSLLHCGLWRKYLRWPLYEIFPAVSVVNF